MMGPDFIGVIRSLGQGSLLGAGTISLVSLMFPTLFPGNVSIEVVAIAGGMFGAGLHQCLSPAVEWLLFRPLIKFTKVYGRLVMAIPLLPFMSVEQRKQILQSSVAELAAPGQPLQLQLPALGQQSQGQVIDAQQSLPADDPATASLPLRTNGD